MISIALCDDEVKYLDFYEQKIKKIANKHQLLVDIIRFHINKTPKLIIIILFKY